MSQVRVVSIGIVLLSLLAAGAITARRMAVERANRSVEIVVEWDEIRELALATRGDSRAATPATLLRHLRETHQIHGVAVSEMTLAELRDIGEVFLSRELPPGFAASTPARSGAAPHYLIIPDARLADQILRHVSQRRSPAYLTPVPSSQPGGSGPVVLRLNARYDLIKSAAIGFPPEAIQAAAEAGVEVIARFGGFTGLTEGSVDAITAYLRELGIRNVIFSGTEVLGNKKLLPYVADSLLRHQIRYGFLEFGKQQGDAALARLMRGQLIRVHSITGAEMAQMTPADATERFVKAARERNIRLLYLRFFTRPADSLVDENSRYLSAIERNMRRVGLTIGQASPFSALYTGRPLLLLTGAGVIAGGVLLLALALGIAARTQWLLLLLGISGSSLLLAIDPTLTLARKALALLAALIFPTLAFLRWGNPPALGGPSRPDLSVSPLRALGPMLAMTATTLAGALLIVGLLGDSRFLLKYDQFVGIKAAHLLPLLALGAILVGGLFTPAADWKSRRSGVAANLRAILAEPVRVWQIVAVGAAMLLLLLLLLRTGNEPGVGVSGLELKLRSLMDRVLFVRPRTKEFLIGHPAMVIALWAALAGWRPVWAPALLIGGIGQVSLLNTFCHIHTPFLVSLLRTTNGLVLGIVLGLAVIAVAQRLWVSNSKGLPLKAPAQRGSGPE